jgi:hypothetical protein
MVDLLQTGLKQAASQRPEGTAGSGASLVTFDDWQYFGMGAQASIQVSITPVSSDTRLASVSLVLTANGFGICAAAATTNPAPGETITISAVTQTYDSASFGNSLQAWAAVTDGQQSQYSDMQSYTL